MFINDEKENLEYKVNKSNSNMLVNINNNIKEQKSGELHSFALEYIEHKKFKGIQKKYINILDKYFRRGIHLNSYIDMNKFKIKLQKDEGYINFDDNHIRTVLKSCTILINNDLRISPENLLIEKDLLEDIIVFVIDIVLIQNNVLSSEVLYNRFRTSLLYTNIYDATMLNNVIDFYMGNDVNILNETITRIENRELNIENLILNYLKGKRCAVQKTELIKNFKGISVSGIEKVLKKNDAIICLSYDMFIYADFILLDELEKSNLIDILFQQTKESFITIKNLLFILNKEIPSLVQDNDFVDEKQILRYLKYISKDNFKFKYGFVGRPNQKISGVEAVLEFLEGRQTFTLSELQDFVDSKGLPKQYNIFLRHIGKSFIRLNKEEFMSVSVIDLKQDVIKEIEESLIEYMDKKYISVQKINNFIFLPRISYKWTTFLLESVVNVFCNKLKVINYYNGVKEAKGIIVKNDFNINDKDSLLLTAAIDRNNIYPFTSESELLKFWLEEELLYSKRYANLSAMYRRLKEV